MPVFRGDFTIAGDLVFPHETPELSHVAGEFRFTLRNAPIDSEGHAPGLIAVVVGPADSMDSAQETLRSALAAQLDLLAFATHSRFRILAPQRVIEWNEGQKQRQFRAYHTTDSRYPPDPELTAQYLETTAALHAAEPPDFAKMALRYFRYGLIDDQTEDQFMRFWLALEIIAENVKTSARVPITCPVCKAALKCGLCGTEPTRVPIAKQAIENLIATLAGSAAPALSRKLFKARNGLMHGRSTAAIEADCQESLSDLVNDLGALTWHAIWASIPLGEGPQLAFGHRDGKFANTSLVMYPEIIFEHTGDDAHPSDDRIPKVEITMLTRFRKPEAPG